MVPRRFTRLANLPDDKLFPEIEAGLTLPAQNVAYLAEAATVLDAQGYVRPARILGGHAEDESGKFLVLMDGARCPRDRLEQHLKRADSHLPRLLYAETARLRPHTFGELVRYLDMQRPSHYLDGPAGVEWIFRNLTLYLREQALYVDYVEQEDGTCAWQDPDHFAKTSTELRPRVIAAGLVAALVDAGLHRAPALAVVAARWRPFLPSTDTDINAVRDLIVQTLCDLKVGGMLGADQSVWDLIIESWTFPFWSTELSFRNVKREDLQEERAHYNSVPYDWE